MSLQFEKIDSVLSEKRIKLHIFEPSNRKIWTVVGTEREYWLDPYLDFCSCPGYYFNNECYHLDTLTVAIEVDKGVIEPKELDLAKNKIEIITFSDLEYEDFIAGLLSDL
uniref:SWIM-type domain-containing protein n=1 Tax=uncultured marine thaumarchaeote KM3_15_E05 TaxID=1456027 RepID=A0A075GLR9_9ARCH|nr:hypothetical protein [uncultured marine thaumarchaeote KM3_15_E05]